MDEVLTNIFAVLNPESLGRVDKAGILTTATEQLADLQGLVSGAILDAGLAFLEFLLEPAEWHPKMLETSTRDSGTISEEEFILFAKRHAQSMVISGIFVLIDANGDGKLSKAEMTKALTRQAAEVTRRVQDLEAIGLVSNADVLMKPRASLKLISDTETAEPGFVTMKEFLKAIAGKSSSYVRNEDRTDGNAAANATEDQVYRKIPDGAPQHARKLPGTANMPMPPKEPIKPKELVSAPPPPIDFPNEPKDDNSVDSEPPPPPPPAPAPVEEKGEDIELSETESVDTIESIDTADDDNNGESAGAIQKESYEREEKNLNEEKQKEEEEEKVDSKIETTLNPSGRKAEMPGNNTVVDELQELLSSQFSDLESQILGSKSFRTDTKTDTISNSASILTHNNADEAVVSKIASAILSDDKNNSTGTENARADGTTLVEAQGSKKGHNVETKTTTEVGANDDIAPVSHIDLIPVINPTLSNSFSNGSAPSTPRRSVAGRDASDSQAEESPDDDNDGDSIQVPHLHGWRPPSRSSPGRPERRASMVSGPGARLDNMPHMPASPHPSDRMPIQPGLGAIDIFDPKNIRLPSEAECRRMRSEALSKLWCPEGLEVLWDAVEGINTYKPTARRFSTEEMRQHMNVQMKSFRREQVRRFYEEVKTCLDIRAMMPQKYAPKSTYGTSYWNWEFKNLAHVIVSTLQEVDWLSEDAKPRFRSAFLAISEFKLFVEKEQRKYSLELQRRLAHSTTKHSWEPPVKQLLSPILPGNHVALRHDNKALIELEALIHEAGEMVQCKKGLPAMGAAVMTMLRYDPQAGRWKERGREVQKFMCDHMTSFRHQIGRKCASFFSSIVTKSQILPKDWDDPNNSFWDFYMQDVAEKAQNALLEVDWLPESAKPLLRALFLTLEQFTKYQDRMIGEAARRRRASTVEWKTGVDTSLQRLGITTALARSPGIGYFPSAKLRIDPAKHKGLRRKGIKVMPSRKGMAAMDLAVHMMQEYVPQGGKWRHPGIREIKIKEMRDFLMSQGHKFHIELQRILNLRKELPNKWEDPNVLFWDCHLEEVAADICTHLMEVDWLPEAAKPVLRQAYLSITRYGNHIQRELRRYENARSDVGLEIRNTILRVKEDHANRARAKALARSMKIREDQAKNERDQSARDQLLRDTEIRLMFHEVQHIQQAIGAAELRATADVGAGELKNIQVAHKSAIAAYRTAASSVLGAHNEIEARRGQLSPAGPSQQHSLVPQEVMRPNTRGGDGGRSGRRRRKKELEPISGRKSSSARPSTAPGGSSKRRRAKRSADDKGGGGEGAAARGQPKQCETSALAAWSSTSPSVSELRDMLVEAEEGVHKYLDDLGRKHRTAIYNKKRRSQRRGAELRAVSQRRLNNRARKKRNKRPKVFSGEIAKMVEGKIKSTTRRKQFHC